MNTDKDKNLHRMELLIALEYLLKYTNEKNPGKICDIVRYAKDNYDINLNRRCMGSVLKFLYDFSLDHIDSFPFVIEEIQRSNSSIYYVDMKYNMTNDKLVDLLNALNNDKFFKEEDKAYYNDILLDVFSNKLEENIIKNALNNTNIKRQKTPNNRNLELVKKALNNDLRLLTIYRIYDSDKKKFLNIKNYYRVYRIIEYGFRAYAIMLQVNDTSGAYLKLNKRNILVPIDELIIPKLSERELFLDDDERDFNELFKKNFPNEFNLYGSLDNYIDKLIKPDSGNIINVSFYFPVVLIEHLKRSFQNFFNSTLKYKKLNIKKTEEKYNITLDNNYSYYLVDLKVDLNAFMSWGFSDPHNTGFTNIFNMINILEPLSINDRIKAYYKRMLDKYM